MADRLLPAPDPTAPGAGRAPGRRRFLARAGALGAVVLAGPVLAACGDDGDGATADGDGAAAGDLPEGIVGGLGAARFFGPYYRPERPARVPFGLTDDEGLLPAELSPDVVTVSVRSPSGETLVEGVEAAFLGDGLPRGYYVFEFTPDVPGFHDVTVDVDGSEVVTQVQVVEADDPVASAIVGPGDALPALATPTVDDARGVNPICTREPDCDLHGRTVAEVLEAGEPFVLLVATPAFCQTVICGPVLDVLLGVLDERGGDVVAVHAEVFREPEANSVPPVPEDFAPAVTELGLAFEPVLYTVDATGTVVDRIDYVFGEVEIRAALERLVG